MEYCSVVRPPAYFQTVSFAYGCQTVLNLRRQVRWLFCAAKQNAWYFRSLCSCIM